MIPWNAVLALGAAILWGGGDFSGGMGVKATGGSMEAALRFVLMSHAMSFAAVLAIAEVRGDPFPQGAALAWGIAAGLTGGFAICLFYVALARGGMGVSAAVSGLLAAAIPALVSVGVDGAPGLRRVVGFVAAGFAIWLIGAGGEESGGKGTLGLAVVSGAGFGLYFTCLKFAGAAGVVWPMGTARMGSLSLCGLMLLGVRLKGTGERVRIRREAVIWAVGTAVLDTAGNMLYIAATRVGRLDVASVLASLYPATTILAAAWVLKEAPTRRQGLGMGVAMAAVLLITL